MSQWTLFSNHGHVLLFLAREPDARLRDVAEAVGITERAVQKIVRDLQDGAVISVSKKGRRNRYRINGRKPLRHELEAHRTVGSLVKLMKENPRQAEPKKEEPRKEEPRKDEPVAVQATEVAASPLAAPPEPEPAPVATGSEEPEPVMPVPEEPARSEGSKKTARKKKSRKKPSDDQQGSLF